MPESTEHRNITAGPVPLASGQILAPGDTAHVSDDPHDLALIADGALLPVEKPATKKKES